MKKVKYRATNNKTGEVIEGYAEEMRKTLNVGLSTLYTAATTGRKIGGKWSVDKIDESDTDNDYKFTRKNLSDWDRVTAPFKQASERKKRDG